MEKAKEVLNALEAELEAAMVKVPVTAVQVEVLMENKAAMLVRLREALHCMVEIDRAQKVVKVVAPQEDMAKAKEEVEKALVAIVEKRIAIPARVGGVFVGTKGMHISSVRSQFHVALEFEKEELCVGGAAENVAAATAAIEAWVKEHTVKELRAAPELAFPCLVGVKGEDWDEDADGNRGWTEAALAKRTDDMSNDAFRAMFGIWPGGGVPACFFSNLFDAEYGPIPSACAQALLANYAPPKIWPIITWTAEEAEVTSTVGNDINSYMKSFAAQVIRRRRSLS